VAESAQPLADLAAIYAHVAQRVVGRHQEIKLILAAIAKQKPILLLGLPGVSKTTILKEIAHALSNDRSPLLFSATGDEQLTAFALTGSFDPALVLQDGYKEHYFIPGPLAQAMRAGGILYLEELNRAPSGVLNVLITALSDGYIDVPRLGRIVAQPGFTVVGASNPLDDVGTGRLSHGLLDRFIVLELIYQSRDEECEIVRQRTGDQREGLIAYAVEIARASRSHPDLRHGASVRGAIDFVQLLEGYAAEELTRETLHFLGCSAYGSKVQVKPTAQRTSCAIITEIMDELLARNFGGQVEQLLKMQAPWGEQKKKTNLVERATSETSSRAASAAESRPEPK
jgi:MoxR-like ATPase